MLCRGDYLPLQRCSIAHLDGATVCAQISHDADAAGHARYAARVLIEDAL